MRGSMMPGASIHVAVVLMLGVAGVAAQELVEARGAWRLLEDGKDFALRTPALDAPDSTLSLLCRFEQQRYAFEIKSPALAALPSGEDIRVGFKVDDDDQVFLTLATGRDGAVPILHLTAFWIIHAALTRADAKNVAFTAGDHTWKFALDGLAGLTERMPVLCGFEADRTPTEAPDTTPGDASR
jgi:hypothetical protein